MNRMLSLCFLLFSLSAMAQEDSLSYSIMISRAEEVQLTDSVEINAIEWKLRRLDSVDVKKWFSAILGTTNNNRLKNRGYYLGGKITTHQNFDLLVLLEEKKRKDTSNAAAQVIYLISMRKYGRYISSLEVAITGLKKRSVYNTTSWLYKDLKVIKDSKFTVSDKPFYDLATYKINGGGRFILYPND